MEDFKELRRLNDFEVLELARKKGLIVGGVIMNSGKFVKHFHLYKARCLIRF